MIFRCQQLDRAHANTYWRKTFLLPGMWKKIFHCQQAEHENSNILCVKPYCCWECGKNFPGPDTSTDTCEHTLGCWLLSFSYANTHWIENHFCCFWCRMFFGRSRGLTRSKNSCQCFYCCEKPHCCCSQCSARFSNCCTCVKREQYSRVCRLQICDVRDSIKDISVTESTLDEHERHLRRLLDAASSCDITLNESKTQHRVTTVDVPGQCF